MEMKNYHYLLSVVLIITTFSYSCDKFSWETEEMEEIPVAYQGLWSDVGGDFLMNVGSKKIEIFERKYPDEKRIRTPIKIEYVFSSDCKYCESSYLKITFSREMFVEWRSDFYNYQYQKDMVLFETETLFDPD